MQRDNPKYFLPERKVKELEDLGGYAILKSLTEYEFPDGEPEYTATVLENIEENEKKLSNSDEIKPLAIHRILKANPDLAKELKKS